MPKYWTNLYSSCERNAIHHPSTHTPTSLRWCSFPRLHFRTSKNVRKTWMSVSGLEQQRSSSCRWNQKQHDFFYWSRLGQESASCRASNCVYIKIIVLPSFSASSCPSSIVCSEPCCMHKAAHSQCICMSRARYSGVRLYLILIHIDT